MRIDLSARWLQTVMADERPQKRRRRVRGLGLALTVGTLVIGTVVVGTAVDGTAGRRPDVTLAADRDATTGLPVHTTGLPVHTTGLPVHTTGFTVQLTAFDGVEPFDVGDGAGFDTGPSNGIVRPGDPVTYVVDIGVGERSLSDVVMRIPIPRGLTLASVPEYCRDGSAVGEFELVCHIGDVGARRYLTNAVTMTAGPHTDTEGLPIAAVVSTAEDAVDVWSNAVTVRITTTAGSCDPQGLPVMSTALPGGVSVSADGRISGVVTGGLSEEVAIVGVDVCGHVVNRAVSPHRGEFSFLGLLPGIYRVTVESRAGVDVVLHSDARDIELTF